MDWAHGEAGIPLAFALELRDKGDHGFELPAAQIIQTSEELWLFTEVLAKSATGKDFENKSLESKPSVPSEVQ